MMAIAAMNMTIGGLKFLQMGNYLGAADFKGQFSKVVGILNVIGMVLCFAGFVFGAAMFMGGRTEMAKYGLIGGMLGGLSWVIVKFFFEQGSGETIDVELDF